MAAITIDYQNAQKLREIFERISNTQVSTEQILNILHDWESRSMLTAKKMFATTAIFLAIAHFIQVDYNQLPFTSLTNEEATFETTLILLVLLAFAGFAYWWHRRIDLKMRQWRVSEVTDRMEGVGKALDHVQELIGETSAIDFRKVAIHYPVRDGQLSRIQHSSSAMNAYYFYSESFVKQEFRRLMYERFEFILLAAVAAYGLVGIVRFWLWG